MAMVLPVFSNGQASAYGQPRYAQFVSEADRDSFLAGLRAAGLLTGQLFTSPPPGVPAGAGWSLADVIIACFWWQQGAWVPDLARSGRYLSELIPAAPAPWIYGGAGVGIVYR